MTAQPTSDVNADSDVINHPRHYNTHPSGVECIEYAELLPGNLSHACVYVWRHAHKGRPIEDLEKARWFLTREISRTPSEIVSSRETLGLEGETLERAARADDRLRHLRRFEEQDEFIATVVCLLFEYDIDAAIDCITHEIKTLLAKASP